MEQFYRDVKRDRELAARQSDSFALCAACFCSPVRSVRGVSKRSLSRVPLTSTPSCQRAKCSTQLT